MGIKSVNNIQIKKSSSKPLIIQTVKDPSIPRTPRFFEFKDPFIRTIAEFIDAVETGSVPHKIQKPVIKDCINTMGSRFGKGHVADTLLIMLVREGILENIEDVRLVSGRVSNQETNPGKWTCSIEGDYNGGTWILHNKGKKNKLFGTFSVEERTGILYFVYQIGG